MGDAQTQTNFDHGSFIPIREQLIKWGAKNFSYVDDTGRIKADRYLHEVIKPQIKGNKFGELDIPTELINLISNNVFLKNTRLGLLSAMMGYGHRRTANAFFWTARALGINTTEICFGDPSGQPVTSLDKIFMAINKEYFMASNREAVRNGMLKSGEEYVPEYNSGGIGRAAGLLRKFLPGLYDSLFLGRTNKKINEKSVYTVRSYMRYLFMVSIKQKFKHYRITEVLNFYPLLNFLLDREAVTVATDAVVNPLGWTPIVRQILERKEAIDKFSGFSAELRNNLEYGNGFAAPTAGLIKTRQLSESRSEKFKKGWPLLLILPASQVATAQLESFREIILGCRNIRIVVQCGNGPAGEVVKNRLKEWFGNRNDLLLYNAINPEAAIEFWEAAAGCDIPMAVAVKGSEMSRMTVELNIPHIALGAIGEQELWNLTIGLIQGAPLILTSRAYQQVTDFINGKNFASSEKDWLLAKADLAKAENYTSAISKAQQMISLGVNNIVPVQRDFMLKVLAFLFTGKKGLFKDNA